MKPIKCPIEEEGEVGTVHGLIHTNKKPKTDINLPIIIFILPFEERESQAPIAIMDRGNQKNATAFIMSSILRPMYGY
jgi:hypothetical protein